MTCILVKVALPMNLPDPDITEQQPVPPDVRFVKRLVIVLTSVMIVGIAVIVGLLALRLSAPPALPQELDLPDGVTAGAVTLARDWVLVLDADGTEVLLFDRATGALRHRVALPRSGEN
jgi:hypothetical protein